MRLLSRRMTQQQSTTGKGRRFCLWWAVASMVESGLCWWLWVVPAKYQPSTPPAAFLMLALSDLLWNSRHHSYARVVTGVARNSTYVEQRHLAAALFLRAQNHRRAVTQKQSSFLMFLITSPAWFRSSTFFFQMCVCAFFGTCKLLFYEHFCQLSNWVEHIWKYNQGPVVLHKPSNNGDNALAAKYVAAHSVSTLNLAKHFSAPLSYLLLKHADLLKHILSCHICLTCFLSLVYVGDIY